MSVIEFQGRTADLLVFHGKFPSEREQLVALSLAPNNTGGLLCTGIQKTAQRVLITLLNKRGSVLYRETDGTAFMTDMERGAWRTQADVFQSFTASKLTLMRQLRGVEEETDPEDERVDDVELENVELEADSVSLTFRLTTLSGDDYTFIAPIPVTTH